MKKKDSLEEVAAKMAEALQLVIERHTEGHIPIGVAFICKNVLTRYCSFKKNRKKSKK